MTKLKIAGVQMECKPCDVSANLDKMMQLGQEAIARGAEIIVYPELVLTGYNPLLIGSRFYDLAEKIPGPSTDDLSNFCRENKVYIVFSMAEKSTVPGIIYISGVVIDDAGVIRHVYRKIHLWHLERMYFTPSSSCQYGIFDVFDIKAGVMICYDSAFPETTRTLALMGAKIVFAPAAWNEDDGSYWDIFVRARALENHVFFIGVNRVGLEKDLRLYGSSQIVDPRGNILAAGGKEEEIIVATIDLSEVEKAHITQPHLKDRRPEAYNLVSSKSNF